MQINPHAPLVAQKQTTINAPIGKVWSLLSNINHWPDWQPEVSQAQLQGPLQKGTTFTWKALGMNIHSQLQTVKPKTQIGWTGQSLGMSAIHFWHLHKHGQQTLVTTEESLSGWLPRLIKLFQPHFLDQSLQKSLSTLKHQAQNTQ